MEIKGLEKYGERSGDRLLYENSNYGTAKVMAEILHDREAYGKAVARNIFSRLIARAEMGELLNAETLRNMAKEYGVFLEDGQ